MPLVLGKGLVLPDDAVSQTMVVYGGKGMGKRLALDTKLPTPTGWTTMGEVTVGTTLFDDCGRPCRITYVSPIQLGDSYRVVFSDGSVIRADAEHLWSVMDYRGRRRGLPPQVCTTDELRRTLLTKQGKQLARTYSVTNTRPLRLPRRRLPIDPYVLGVWLGDGSERSGSVTVGVGDECTVAQLAAKYDVTHEKRQPNKAPAYYVRRIKFALRKLGLLQNKHVPQRYMRASQAQRLALLQGLMDTDGDWNDSASMAEFGNKNEALSAAVYELVCSLGMKATRRSRPAKLSGKDCGLSHRVRFVPIVQVFRMPRKAERWQPVRAQLARRTRRYIVAIDKTVDVPMRCLTIDSPSHLYLAGDAMVPTHNTVFGAVLAEELARHKKRFSVIDPVGRSWGLRYGADGKSPGLEILILGGRHGDIPIEPTGGAVVADLVVNENVDTLIDISSRADGTGWTHGEKLKFVGAYCNRLYERGQAKRRPMMQIIDEAGRFAMQQIPHGAFEASICLGAVEQLVELGRNAGIGVCLITQRSARMAKSVSELASAMIAFRTVGPNSVAAILDWFGEHVEKPKWKELLEQLRTLTIGEALVVSPGWLELERSFKIRMRTTFDSSATPKGGGERHAKGGRAPNLEKYRELMAATITAAEANDPKKLAAKLKAAEAEIAKLQKAKAAPGQQLTQLVDKIVKVPALTDDQLERMLGRIDGAVRTLHDNVLSQVAGLRNAVIETKNALARSSHGASAVRPAPAKPIPAAIPAKPITPPHRAPDKPTKQPTSGETPATPKGGLRRMLIALAQCPAGLTRKQVAVRAGMAQSGTFGTYLSTGRTNTWLYDQGGKYFITAEGVAVLGDYTPLPTGQALFDYWSQELKGGAARMLQALHEARAGLTRAQLAEAAGMSESGTFGTYLSKLNTLDLVEKQDGLIVVNEDLYDA